MLEDETVSAGFASNVDVDAPVCELAQGIQGSQVVAFCGERRVQLLLGLDG